MRRASVALVGLLLAVSGLPEPLPAVASTSAVGQEAAQGAPPPVPAPIPDGERLPLPAYPDENWIVDPPEGSIALPDGEVGIDQMLEAGFTHEPARGGPNYDVFTLPGGGEHAALVYPGIVNEQRSDGTWQRIDRNLFHETGAGYRATTGGATMLFPGSLALDAPISTQFSGRAISLVPLAPAGASAAVSADTVSYVDIAPGVDATYTVGIGGFKEVLTLRQPVTEPIVWNVTAPGFDLRAEPTGEVAFLRAGDVAAVMPVATLTDSSTPTRSAVGSYTVTRTGPTSFVVQLALDPAYLAEATYPVMIDPGSQTLFAAGADDTYVDSANPNTDFRSSYLQVTSAPSTKRTYARHDTASLERNERIVYSADFALYISAVLGGRQRCRKVEPLRRGLFFLRSRGPPRHSIQDQRDYLCRGLSYSTPVPCY